MFPGCSMMQTWRSSMEHTPTCNRTADLHVCAYVWHFKAKCWNKWHRWHLLPALHSGTATKRYTVSLFANEKTKLSAGIKSVYITGNKKEKLGGLAKDYPRRHITSGTMEGQQCNKKQQSSIGVGGIWALGALIWKEAPHYIGKLLMKAISPYDIHERKSHSCWAYWLMGGSCRGIYTCVLQPCSFS